MGFNSGFKGLIWFTFTVFLLLFTTPNSYCTWLSCLLQSQAVGDAAYDSDWLDASPNIKRSLNLVIRRAKRPCKVTAGKFMDLNLESYFLVCINVVNTLHIFMVLFLTNTNLWKINPNVLNNTNKTLSPISLSYHTLSFWISWQFSPLFFMFSSARLKK